MNRAICFFVVTFCLAPIPAAGQEKTPQETAWRVPELDRLHEPIAALWHDAWPNKDMTKLKELLPAVEKGSEELAAAHLPGILREKKPVWDEKLKALEEAVKGYHAAVAGNALQPILDAVEKVHAGYEAMVRVIRPVLKELDAFHQVLYVVHHEQLPAGDIAGLRISADSLSVRMGALNAAVLPDRLRTRDARFQKARTALAESVTAFGVAVRSNRSREQVQSAESSMHTRYQAVENVFE